MSNDRERPIPIVVTGLEILPPLPGDDCPVAGIGVLLGGRIPATFTIRLDALVGSAEQYGRMILRGDSPVLADRGALEANGAIITAIPEAEDLWVVDWPGTPMWALSQQKDRAVTSWKPSAAEDRAGTSEGADLLASVRAEFGGHSHGA